MNKRTALASIGGKAGTWKADAPIIPRVYGRAKVKPVLIFSQWSWSEGRSWEGFSTGSPTEPCSGSIDAVLAICQAGATIRGVWRGETFSGARYNNKTGAWTLADEDDVRRAVRNLSAATVQGGHYAPTNTNSSGWIWVDGHPVSYDLEVFSGPVGGQGWWKWTRSTEAYAQIPQVDASTPPAWAYLTGTAAGQGWAGLTHVRYTQLALDVSGGKLPDIHFLVDGIGGVDCLPSVAIRDVLVNLMGFSTDQVVTNQGTDGNYTSSTEAYEAAWPAMRVNLATTATASDLLEMLLEACNCEVIESGGLVKVVPLGDRARGSFVPASYTYVVDGSDVLNKRPILRMDVTDQRECFNQQPVSYLDAADKYEQKLVCFQDDHDIALRGERQADSISNECVTTAAHALLVSQVAVKRSLTRRRRVQFNLPPRWMGLEPGDLVQVTDGVSMPALVVRLTDIEEQDDYSLACEGWEWSGRTDPHDLAVEEPEPTPNLPGPSNLAQETAAGAVYAASLADQAAAYVTRLAQQNNLFPNCTSETIPAGATRAANDGWLVYSDGTQSNDATNIGDPERGFVYDTQYWPTSGVNSGYGGSRYVRNRRCYAADPMAAPRYYEMPSVYVPCQAGDVFTCRAMVRCANLQAGTAGAYVGVRWYDANKVCIGYQYDNAQWDYRGTTWASVGSSGAAPAGTAFVGTLIGVDNGVTNPDGTNVFFDAIDFHKVSTIGPYTADDWQDRVISGVLGATTDSGGYRRRAYNGSNDFATNTGTPGLLSAVTVQFMERQQIGTTGQYKCTFQVTLHQSTNQQANWDGLRTIKLAWYKQSALGLSSGITVTADNVFNGSNVEYKTIADRVYYDPTNDANSNNNVSFTFQTVMPSFQSSVYPALMLSLQNTNGWGPAYCFYAPAGWTASGGTLTCSGTSFPSSWGGSPPSGGGGGGGGGDKYCVAPETPVLLGGGHWKPIGELDVCEFHEDTSGDSDSRLIHGDAVYTLTSGEPSEGCPGGSREWGMYNVQRKEVVQAEARLRLRFEDGRELVCTPSHPLASADWGWVDAGNVAVGDLIQGTQPGVVSAIEDAGPGPVVKLSMQEAFTFIANGLLSHNKQWV